MENRLEKSAMAFKLKDGTVLLIDNEDIEKIVEKIKVEMLYKQPEKILMITDPLKSRADFMYQIYKEQRDVMSDELREEYLKSILLLNTDKDFGVETLKENLEKAK